MVYGHLLLYFVEFYLMDLQIIDSSDSIFYYTFFTEKWDKIK